jgi:putative transcriptional regulator
VQKQEWLINLRNTLELTQEQVATEAGISRVYYNMIESGLRKPSVKAAQGIAKAFNIDWWIFFEDKRFDMKRIHQPSITD